MKRLHILGAGAVGRTLARQFQQHQVFSVEQILNRSQASAEAAAAFIGVAASAALANAAQLQAAEVWMLSVADDQIVHNCEMLAQQGLLTPQSVVFHCSGAKPSSILAAAADCGAAIASIHPVRSFADPAAVAADFAGTICSIEGEARALAVLKPALQRIGAQIVEIRADSKLLYHAGSVFASNYLVSLLETAMRSYQAAGISADMAQAMAAPLARRALENVFALGPAAALSGPIARGDIHTVEQQQAALDGWDSLAGELYRAFTAPTLALAAQKVPPPHSEK